MFVEGVKIINTQYKVFISDDLILKTPSSFLFFVQIPKTFVQKIIESGRRENKRSCTKEK